MVSCVVLTTVPFTMHWIILPISLKVSFIPPGSSGNSFFVRIYSISLFWSGFHWLKGSLMRRTWCTPLSFPNQRNIHADSGCWTWENNDLFRNFEGVILWLRACSYDSVCGDVTNAVILSSCYKLVTDNISSLSATGLLQLVNKPGTSSANTTWYRLVGIIL